MANYQLTVEKRTTTGKSYARKLRAENKIPAVVYGFGKPAINLEVPARDAEKALASSVSLIDLDLAGEARTVIVKDIHKDPVRGHLLHLDFHEVDLAKKLEVKVPIRITGEELRLSDGGVVSTLLWEVTVSCLPTDIPEAIDVDVSELELDGGISIGELTLSEDIEILEDPDELLVKVSIPTLKIEEEEEEVDVEEEDVVEGEEAEVGAEEPETSEE